MANSSLSIGLTILAAAFFCEGGTAEPGIPSSIEQAHVASRESLQDFSCKVQAIYKVHTPPEFTRKTTGQYWRSAHNVRADCQWENARETYILRDSVITTLRWQTDAGRQTFGTSRFQEENQSLTDCDAWQLAHLAINLPGTITYFRFEQLVAKASSVRTLANSSAEYRVALDFDTSDAVPDKWHAEIYLDPKSNYLVRKCVFDTRVASGKKIHRENQITSFVECSPGLFFPTTVEIFSEIDGVKRSSVSAAFTDVLVGHPIKPTIFDVSFPHGALMMDSVQRVSYYVNASGQAISEKKPIRSVKPPPATSLSIGNTDVLRQRIGEASHHESRSWTRLIAPISGAFLVIGVLLHLAKRHFRTRSG